MILNKLVLGLVAIGMFMHSDSIFFRSEALHHITLHRVPGEYWMIDDDGNKVHITRLEDDKGLIYWHRRIKTAVCQTGECKLVDVGIYWDCKGDFFGLEVYEHLTKTDHSTFSQEDYDQLIAILSDDWSILREYVFADLTVETDSQGVDATSGATRKDIASEAVKDAVYTTYTLWHLIHSGEKEQLEKLTVELLRDEFMIQKLLAASIKKYDNFLLSLLAQSKVLQSPSLNRLIIDGLQSEDDPFMQNLAFKALGGADVNSPEFQEEVASLYEKSSSEVKLRILTSLKDIKEIHQPFSQVLTNDLDVEREWLAVKILPLMTVGPSPSSSILEIVRRLSGSKNSHVRESAIEFLKVHN